MPIKSVATSLGFAMGSLLLFAGVAASPPSRQATKNSPTGQQLFLSRCAKCHGADGKGGSQDPAPMTGSLSAKELTAFIKRSMPPGPKKCASPEADKIAAFIYEAFYSPVAQARNRPPRVELVRLTVRQFQNAVTDLISGFHPATPNTTQHGLYAEYFKGRSRDGASRLIQRVDPDIRFDFGTEAPDSKGFDPRNFSIAWSGSVLAPDTGEYEFSIHAKHSCQLWINGSRTPIVDGEVRSAGDEDPKGTITLLGGRAYSLYMVFTKATQGVDDANKKNTKPSAPSFVTLLWRRPTHVTEPIPTQFLYPQGVAKSFVSSTPFPPDDRSNGYERGDSVSREWDDATTAAALEAAEYVVKNLQEVTGVAESTPNRAALLQSYCKGFLERAFRRPLSDETKRTYLDKQFSSAATPEAAVKRVVLMALKSPRFLYREIGAAHPDGYYAAAQLSFGLWDTLPDPQLEDAAAKGQLDKPEQLAAQATRMLNDNRAWSKLRQFLLLWLRVDEVPDIVKNAQHFPAFDARVASDLRTSLELYLQSTTWSSSSDFRDLMLSDKQFVNGRLAAIYGVNLPTSAPFQEVSLDPGQRAGIVTNPYLLARFGYLDSSDPIHRGVLIYRNLLGQSLKPPPANFVPLAAGTHPEFTTRQRVSLQTKPEFCANCHARFNPLGFTLEKFDAIGRLRADDNGKPIDCSGVYRSKAGDLVKLNGALDTARYLAESEDARSAFIQKLFLTIAKQAPRAYGATKLDELDAAFVKNQYSIRSLLIDMVVATALPSSNKSPSKTRAKT